ncbi:MAG: threonylcarbamoyl-AMP synthase [Candidatus Schekmanbacteria bacterium RBG_16_38_11]|uniref:L-threonylcarbamoyladenylate synthase n=1 Tax=Candidatus Schekmanbacteria bacterium RBG_16_38_11 TaxID=1817880 RepID=A0A1F7RXU3_9BACT|nr:MAG: threonylcarbamoyl-AMP synthase [Candidatus Schekmanbacteria bacterium RBG_16_38_11]
MTEIIKVDPLKPDLNLLMKAEEVLRKGGVIAYPTDTVYGLGVNALNEEAVRKVFSLKKRDESKPLLLVVSEEFNLKKIITEVSPQALKLIKTFWPGPLTIIFKANNKLSPLLTGGTGKIGVRAPDNLIALKLLSLCRFPITSTSANPSGMEEAKTAEEVKNYFSKKIDLIIDGGKCQKALPSTIVEIEKGEIKVLRKGMISEEIIASALTK